MIINAILDFDDLFVRKVWVEEFLSFYEYVAKTAAAKEGLGDFAFRELERICANDGWRPVADCFKSMCLAEVDISKSCTTDICSAEFDINKISAIEIR